jgi:uncharacterized protein YbaP (TraB family)
MLDLAMTLTKLIDLPSGRTATAWLALALSMSIASPTLAQTEPCARRNLVDVVEERSPGTRQRILDVAARGPHVGAMLFRVDGEGRKPSYVYGTVHVADERLQALPQEVEAALNAASVVVLERGDVSEQAVRSVMPLAARLMMMPRNQALDSLIDEDEMKVVTRAVKASGLAPELARILRPWAATLFLAGSECEKARFEAGLKPLDYRILEAAREKKIRIVGLEQIVEQYESLAAVPDDVQVAWLRSSIKLYQNIDDMSETTVALYLQRKIEAVWDLTVAMTSDVGMTDEMMLRLKRVIVADRNAKMMDRSRALLAEGGAFIAVGALHLGGSDGLVRKIEEAGLKVTPIL